MFVFAGRISIFKYFLFKDNKFIKELKELKELEGLYCSFNLIYKDKVLVTSSDDSHFITYQLWFIKDGDLQFKCICHSNNVNHQ